MQRFAKWPTWQKIWFVALPAVFFVASLVTAIQVGPGPKQNLDGTSESQTIYAARTYVSEGFFKNYLLPTYEPFGVDRFGKPRTEPFVYTHFLPGPPLVLGMVLKIFGKDAIWIGRLVALSLTVFAMLYVSWQFGSFLGSSFMACLFLGLLFVPRSLTVFAIGVHGHSHNLAFLLLYTGAMLYFSRNPQTPKRILWFVGGLAGFLQMSFGLDWTPLTFLTGVALFLILPRFTKAQAKPVLVGMVLGGCFAALLELALASLHFGSLQAAIHDYVEFGRWRATGEGLEGVGNPAALRLFAMIREYNKQAYGATGFTAANLVALSLAFLAMGYAARLYSKKAFVRAIVGTVFAYLAAAFWTITMRHHALIHVHFIPRHYFVLYLVFLIVALSTAYALVRRSKA